MESSGDAASIFDAVGIERVRRACRLDPERVRRLRNALLKDYVPDAAALDVFAAGPAARAPLQLHTLTLHQRHDSAVDGATKLLFRTAAGLLTESVVLRIASGRCTLCVSSQIGCAAACRFCATGTMGIARSLGADEILDQVLHAGQLLATEGRRLRNVVFMGMGEPFHNEAALGQALERLLDPAWFHFSPRKILVSTVGIVDGMVRQAERFPEVGIALSLHSVRQTVRESLIPLAKRYRLDELRRAVVELNRLQPRPVMLEYLMLQGVNDTAEDLAALIAWTEGLDVHLNLIPYNPIADAKGLAATPAAVTAQFAARLKAAGRRTTVRRSLGGDIDAACGQLVKREHARQGL